MSKELGLFECSYIHLIIQVEKRVSYKLPCVLTDHLLPKLVQEFTKFWISKPQVKDQAVYNLTILKQAESTRVSIVAQGQTSH